MLSLNISSVKAIWMIQKAAAKGNWWLAASSQHICWCIMSMQSFLAKHQITQVTQTLYSPDLVPCNFWLFPKTNITFEREQISDHQWNSGKYNSAADGDWENCVRSQSAYFEGDCGVIVLCTVLISSSINISFSYYVADYLLDRPCISSHLNPRK